MTESFTLADTPWGHQRSDEPQSRFLAGARATTQYVFDVADHGGVPRR